MNNWKFSFWLYPIAISTFYVSFLNLFHKTLSHAKLVDQFLVSTSCNWLLKCQIMQGSYFECTVLKSCSLSSSDLSRWVFSTCNRMASLLPASKYFYWEKLLFWQIFKLYFPSILYTSGKKPKVVLQIDNPGHTFK